MRTRRLAALVVVLCCCLQTNPCSASSVGQSIDLADYTARLKGYYALLDGCARNMSESACDSRLVSDVAVRNGGVVRNVGLAWLRNALRAGAEAVSAAASSKDPDAKKQSLEAASATLRDARLRLDQELTAQTQSGVRDIATERAALEKILASGGYAQEVPPTLLQRLWNAFAEWLMRHLTAVAGSEGSQIIVDLFLVSLLVIVCGALLWWFARKVQNQRLALSPPNTPLPSAPSSLDWEQWLEQGKGFAREQRWREAIHHVYWAAISLLESRGFWPADRTRTPREYLTLLAARPETVTDLQPLTRSFEHTWYGHEVAGQAQFDRACALLERLAR